VIAALLGVCLSYLFLGKSRESVARELYQARHPNKEPLNIDADAEDRAINDLENNELKINSERESKSQ
jgi:hypothetical protein